MKRDRAARDILGIFVTRAAWSIMGVISGVLLARWLGPHDRGVLALVLLVPSTVVTLTKLGVSQANIYHINRKQVEIERIAANALVLAITLGITSALAVWALRENLLAGVLQPIPPWALALALTRVPLLLLDNYLFSLLQATGQFGVYNVRLLLSESLRLVLVVVAAVAFELGLFAAVLIYTFVGCVNVTWLLITMSRRIRLSLSLDVPLLADVLRFGVRSYVQTVTAHLLLRIDIYMVAYFLTPAHTAFYALALHFTELVLEIPQAVGLVLYPRLASLPEAEVHRLTAQACRRTLMITLPAALGVALLGPYVIILWYGQPYAPAGAPLPWAAVGVAMMAIFVIVTRNFTSRAKQRVNIGAGMLALISNIALNSIMIPAYGIVGAAVATAISYSGACILLTIFFLYDSHLSLAALVVPRREDIGYFTGVARRALIHGRDRLGAVRAVKNRAGGE